HGSPLVVDSTLAPPYLLRPLDHGADIVIHSATRFLGGHGTTMGGVVVESRKFPWNNGNFPLMTEPVPSYNNLSWYGNVGEFGFFTKLRNEQVRDFGPSLSAQAAYQLLMGAETLPHRTHEHLAFDKHVAECSTADQRNP